ncbi:hypothetical protein ACTNDN_03610 [Niallia sp. HCP3S3_B10]|uniref:hypothetical protein n=1 Tax=unclassified Niallia TaxID=2837522 RepID=UPI00203F80F0|nr:hypothetical protein [Niallia sp. MER TA 168]MCM3364017.1 hypothetical protein [Niallia sp. MER TA 168]
MNKITGKKARSLMFLGFALIFVVIGVLIFWDKETSHKTPSTEVSADKGTSHGEKATGTGEGDDNTESVTKDQPDDAKYQLINGKLVPTTESTTTVGGYYDKLSFIEKNMSKLSDREYETDSIVLTCRTIGAERCEDPLITFKNPPSTVEEAYELLKGHLPIDVAIEGENQTSDTVYEYLLSSNLARESYSEVDLAAGSIPLKLELSNEGKVVKARFK